MRRVLQEPLVHFVVLAVIVFIGYDVFAEIKRNSDNTIVISKEEINRIVSLYEAEAGAPPSGQELENLILGQIREMALAREARKLGMAEDDILIERRLAQKMRFMIADVNEDLEPSNAELEAWFNANLIQFIAPATLSFQHVFFSNPETERMDAVLTQLRSNDDLEWRAFGDPFMLNRVYSDVSVVELSRVFGPKFALQLSTMDGDTEEWRGPIASTLGSHLVHIVNRTEPVIPEFRNVKIETLKAWQAENRRVRTQENIESIVEKYQVVVEAEGLF